MPAVALDALAVLLFLLVLLTPTAILAVWAGKLVRETPVVFLLKNYLLFLLICSHWKPVLVHHAQLKLLGSLWQGKPFPLRV